MRKKMIAKKLRLVVILFALLFTACVQRPAEPFLSTRSPSPTPASPNPIPPQVPTNEPTPTPKVKQTPIFTPSPTPSLSPIPSPQLAQSDFQGYGPGILGLAVTADGETAYVPFELDDLLFAIDLLTMKVTDSIDVSAAGNMLVSSSAILSKDGKWLFVSNYGTGNIAVVSTKEKRIEKVLPLPPQYGVAMATSNDGSKIYVIASHGGLYIINTSDLSYQQVSLPGISFTCLMPSAKNPDVIFAVGSVVTPPGTSPQTAFFTFDTTTNKVKAVCPLSLPEHAEVRRIVTNSEETQAYFGWVDRSGSKGTGNFCVFDLSSFALVSSNPVKNGVADFAINESTGKAYIAGFGDFSSGNSEQMTFEEWDVTQNKLIRLIPMEDSVDQRAVVIDPTNSNYLYMTEGDPANLLRKIDISTGKEVGVIKFNQVTVQPYAIIPNSNTGYVISLNTPQHIYKIDLATGELTGSIKISNGGSGWGLYKGRLYLSDFGTDTIYSIDPDNGQTLNTYHIGINICPIIFTVFGDRIATLDFEPNTVIAKRLVLLDAANMTVLKTIDLPHDTSADKVISYSDKVIASPDGSKLYLEYGPISLGGTTTIMVLDAETLATLNTIEVTATRVPTCGASGFLQGAFDEANRILYLAGHASIYKIDMDTDKLLGILDLVDAYGGLQGIRWSPSAVSGVVLSASKDKLFMTTTDAHCMFTYDLMKGAWLPKITNLKGYFPTNAAASPDHRYLYSVNGRTDSITMVDLTTEEIVKVIRLP